MTQAVLGIDPGRRWTAAVLRVGDRPVDGWTLGPVAPDGSPDPTATDDAHDVAGFARYQARILDAVETTVERHRAVTGPVWLACEVIVPPGGRRIAIADWLIPRQLLAGLLAYDPGMILIRANQHGKRDIAEYPPELRPRRGGQGGRPTTWGVNEARRGERDHERAAFDVAGAAAVVLARRAASSTSGTVS